MVVVLNFRFVFFLSLKHLSTGSQIVFKQTNLRSLVTFLKVTISNIVMRKQLIVGLHTFCAELWPQQSLYMGSGKRNIIQYAFGSLNATQTAPFFDSASL